MAVLERVFKWSAVLSGISLMILAFVILADVSSRALFRSSIPGVFEAASITLLAVTFMSLAWAQYTDRQVRVELVLGRFKGRARHLLETLANLLGLIVFFVILRQGIELLIEAVRLNQTSAGLVQIPVAYPLTFVVVGSLFACISYTLLAIRHLRGTFSPRAAITEPEEALHVKDHGARGHY